LPLFLEPGSTEEQVITAKCIAGGFSGAIQSLSQKRISIAEAVDNKAAKRPKAWIRPAMNGPNNKFEPLQVQRSKS
jgi:hypothetical protein